MDNRIDAGYVRISDGEKQDAKRQELGVAELAERDWKATDIVWYKDTVGKNSRSLAFQRKDFQRMLKDAEAGKIKRIFVDAQDRFGTKDEFQYVGFISRLRDAKCQLIDVMQRKVLTEGDIGTIITGVVGASKSKGEILDKAHRTLDGKKRQVEDGEYQGGNPPYGFDVVCFGPDGNEKWRTIYEGHHKRLKRGVDGHEERYDGKGNAPKKSPNDKQKIRPSQDKQRIETVKMIFNWYANESISPGGIAIRLNKLGVPSLFSPMWSKHNVNTILRDPVYLGRYVWNKVGKGHVRELIDGQEVEAPWKDGQPVKNRKRKHADFIFSTELQFEAFITQETFDKTAARLVEQSQKPHGTTGKKAPKNVGLWLQPFLVCGKCGKPMHGHGGTVNRISPSYFCSTYNRYGKNNPTGCHCHRVPHDRIEKTVIDWLTEHCPKVLEDLKSSANELGQITGPIEKQLADLRQRHADCFCEAWKLVDEHECSTYGEVIEKLKPGMNAAILAKETELDAMLEGFASLRGNLKVRAEAKMQVVQDELDRMKAAQGDLLAPVADLAEEIASREADLAVATIEITDSQNGRRKADLLGKIVDKIVCNFDYKGPKQRSNLLDAKIIAADGTEYIVSPAACKATGEAISHSNEVTPQRNFVAEALSKTYSSAELDQIDPPTGTTRKHCKRHVPLSVLQENGRKAAARRWQLAQERGTPDSRTPEQRAAAGRAAALTVPLEQRRANARKAAASSPRTKRRSA